MMNAITNTNRVTKREYFERLADIVKAANREDEAELLMMIENEVDILDRKAEKAKERNLRKKEEKDAFTEMVYNALDLKEFMNADEVMAFLDEDLEVSRHKVLARLSHLVRTGRAEKRKLPKNEEGKELMGYRKI